MEEEEGWRLETTMGGRACRARQSEEEYKDSHFAAKYSYRASEYSSERCWICPIRFPFTKASNRSTTWSTGLSLHPRPNLPPTKAHIWMGPKFWSALGGPRLWELREGPRVHSLSELYSDGGGGGEVRGRRRGSRRRRQAQPPWEWWRSSRSSRWRSPSSPPPASSPDSVRFPFSLDPAVAETLVVAWSWFLAPIEDAGVALHWAPLFSSNSVTEDWF